MEENHFAYKIIKKPSQLVCSKVAFSESKMLDLLKEIQNSCSKGMYWIFKQLPEKSEEALCIIDCEKGRIYYHYSGEVEAIETVIQKLSQKIT